MVCNLFTYLLLYHYLISICIKRITYWHIDTPKTCTTNSVHCARPHEQSMQWATKSTNRTPTHSVFGVSKPRDYKLKIHKQQIARENKIAISKSARWLKFCKCDIIWMQCSCGAILRLRSCNNNNHCRHTKHTHILVHTRTDTHQSKYSNAKCK